MVNCRLFVAIMRFSLPTLFRSHLLIHAVLSLVLIIGLSCGGSSDSGGDDDDDDGVTAAQCETTCEHVYEECDLVLVDAAGDTLTQAECETSCLDQEETLIDCLEDVACTEAAVNACLEDEGGGGGTDEDECDSNSDCDSSNNETCVSGTCVEQECNSDADCGFCEECISNDCVDDTSPACQ